MCQPTVLRVNLCEVRLLNRLAYARLPWTSICNQSTSLRCARLVVSCLQGMDRRTCNSSNEVEDIHWLWDLGSVAELLLFEYFETKTKLRVFSGNLIGSYRLESTVAVKWVLCYCD